MRGSKRPSSLQAYLFPGRTSNVCSPMAWTSRPWGPAPLSSVGSRTKPLASLTPPEKVELLRIVTAGDLADMQEYGNYSFYRLGISPDGQWKFFSGGD